MTKQAQKPQLVCLTAGRRHAALYRADALDAADKIRLARTPALAGRDDWRVSRYLKQRAVLPVLSLSHSRGRAAVLTGTGVVRAGVDIEYMRPRDFQALAAWVAAPHEREYLAQRGWRSEDFYGLWTVKEALLKAAGLDFPADMHKVGWRWDSDGLKHTFLCGESGWQSVTVKAGDCMLSCAWQGEADLSVEYAL